MTADDGPDHSSSDTSDPTAQQVVAIDGPSGSGKSTVARRLARTLRYSYLDTGAMYRAVTWYLLQRQVPDSVPDAELERHLEPLELRLEPDGRLLVNGGDVTAELRQPAVEAMVSSFSARPLVRRRMRRLQRELAARGPLVAEGRDMATVVFPKARWKFYLDAAAAERARRRRDDFLESGRDVSEAEVLEEMNQRDRLDSSREDAPLRRAEDATYVDTTGMAVDDVVAKLEQLVRDTG